MDVSVYDYLLGIAFFPYMFLLPLVFPTFWKLLFFSIGLFLTTFFISGTIFQYFFIFHSAVFFMLTLMLFMMSRESGSLSFRELYESFHHEMVLRLKKLIYSLFPSYNNVSKCYAQYRAYRLSHEEMENSFREIELKYFDMLNSAQKVNYEINVNKRTYYDTSLLCLSIVLDEYLLYERRGVRPLGEDSPYRLIRVVDEELHARGVYTDDEYQKRSFNGQHHHLQHLG